MGPAGRPPLIQPGVDADNFPAAAGGDRARGGELLSDQLAQLIGT